MAHPSTSPPHRIFAPHSKPLCVMVEYYKLQIKRTNFLVFYTKAASICPLRILKPFFNVSNLDCVSANQPTKPLDIIRTSSRLSSSQSKNQVAWSFGRPTYQPTQEGPGASVGLRSKPCRCPGQTSTLPTEQSEVGGMN